jgi:formate hydrogenlyase subunit 4
MTKLNKFLSLLNIKEIFKFFLEIWMLCILFLYAMNDLQFYWKILFYATELPAICIIIFVVLNYIKYIKNENNNH